MAKCQQHVAIAKGPSQFFVLGHNVLSRDVNFEALRGLWPVLFSPSPHGSA